jgi:hypothetical protein
MRWLVVAVVLVLAGCHETPAQGFEAFYAALGSEDAVQRLSPRAQAAFSGAVRAAGKEPGPALAAAVPKSTVRSIDVVEESGDRALLEIKDALGNTTRVTMVRVEGRWLVDSAP